MNNKALSFISLFIFPLYGVIIRQPSRMEKTLFEKPIKITSSIKSFSPEQEEVNWAFIGEERGVFQPDKPVVFEQVGEQWFLLEQSENTLDWQAPDSFKLYFCPRWNEDLKVCNPQSKWTIYTISCPQGSNAIIGTTSVERDSRAGGCNFVKEECQELLNLKSECKLPRYQSGQYCCKRVYS